MIRTLKYSFLVISSLFIIIAFSGCGGTAQKTARITRLDSLEASLDHLESGLKDLDREQVKESYVSCKDNVQKLYVVFQKDPLAVDDKLMVQYEQLIINLNRLVLDIDNAEKEIQFGIQQIGVWRDAVKKGELQPEDFNQYCHNEGEAIHSLELILVTKSKEWSKMQEQIKKLDPEVKRLISKK